MSSNPVWREHARAGAWNRRGCSSPTSPETWRRNSPKRRSGGRAISSARSTPGAFSALRTPRAPFHEYRRNLLGRLLKPGAGYRTTVRLSNAKPLRNVVVGHRVATVFEVINKLIAD